MKFVVLAFVIGAVTANHYKPPKQLVKPAKAIALVKYKDTVYQCQGVVNTECGYTIHCGTLSVHCMNQLTIEYID